MPALSVLDLVPVTDGGTPADALRHALSLARHAEALGYQRFWLAEHHNMAGIASAATAVVIAHVAGGTSRIRVGAGGIMLPNHAPLVIAEQFGTLESLFPGRIDLGLGRAPGTDQRTLAALRRSPDSAARFPEDVLELQALLAPAQPGQFLQAVPGTGTRVPLWILGSSLYGAHLAAVLGLPYAFASHFAPDALTAALAVYRERFEPSEQLQAPHAMVGVNVIAADSDAEARRLFTSAQQRALNMVRGLNRTLPAPIDPAALEGHWSAAEKAQVSSMLRCSVVGGPATVARDLARLAEETGADEFMVAAAIHDHEARKHAYTVLARSQPRT